MKAARSRYFLLPLLLLSLLVQGFGYSPLAFAAKQKSDKENSDNNGPEKQRSAAVNDGNKGDASAIFDELQSKAFLLVMDSKYDDARTLVEGALSKETNPDKRIALNYLLSAVERMNDDYGAAIKNLNEVLKSEEASKQYDHRKRALLLKRLGDCYWGMRNTKPALSNYSAALQECGSLPANDSLIPSLLESITGTYVFDKNFQEAESTGKRLLQVCEERAKSNTLEDVGAMFWARIQLLGIYRNLGNDAERQKLWNASSGMLDRLLSLREELEKTRGLEEMERMKQEFEQNYIKQFNPQTPAEYLWLASEFRMRSLPLIGWQSKTLPAKAAILCIHGLGLENRAFTDFAHHMQERGFSVYAMDVRGFGSWLTTQGQEDLQFQETLKDIRAMVQIIKEREKNLPVFLLGESMGGAIALRGVAAYGDQFAGVISSVPSAELFQGRRMGFSVAFHLLQGGKNKPFKVGDMVTEQATSNQALTEKWKQDSKAKMEMTPKELIKFAVFMRSTKKECEKIKTTPVFVVQGLKDRLVKPAGTIDLFDAVPGEDKTLLIIGKAEHLIFETFEPNEFLLDGLTTWLNDRIKKPVLKQAESAPVPASATK